MTDIVYVNLKPSVNIACPSKEKYKVSVRDVADVVCSDEKTADRINGMLLLTTQDFPDYRAVQSYVVSIIKLIKLIQKNYPLLHIETSGATEVLIRCRIKQENSNTLKCSIMKLVKILAVCIITLIGSSYAIIAYNNDVGMSEVFAKVYELTGATHFADSNLIEVCYALGLFGGIIIFYNHFAGHRFSKTPTPIEVAMQQYDDDVDTTVIGMLNKE